MVNLGETLQLTPEGILERCSFRVTSRTNSISKSAPGVSVGLIRMWCTCEAGIDARA